MLTTLAALAGLALAQQTDTTVPVRAGARLEVNNFGGEIAVKTWNKSAVRIAASHSSRDRITVDASDQLVRVKSESRRGPSQVVDYEITVPAAMALALSGVYTDISVDGSQGEITAETVQGAVKVSGGAGNVSLKSVQGDVTLEKARGRIDLSSVNETIKASQISGDVSAETVNGDISLVQIESANVEANTVNGDIVYDGTIKDGGRYRFSTHDGDLRVCSSSVQRRSTGSVSRSARAAPGSSSSRSTATSGCVVQGSWPKTGTRTRTTTGTKRRNDHALHHARAARRRGRPVRPPRGGPG